MNLLSKANYDLLIIIIIIPSLLVLTSTASPHIAKPGCNDTCGNVSIPFPFGIGANCAVNEWYVIHCVNSSTPYLSALNNQLEVLGIDLLNQTVTVNTPTSVSNCQYPPLLNSSSSTLHKIKSVDLDDRSPFRFSGTRNKLVVEGCGNAVISHNGTALSGCSTICRNHSSVRENNNYCLGITCCETRIPDLPASIYSYQYTRFPNDLNSYIVELMGALETDDRGGGPCGSAFLVDENLYVEGRFGFDGGVGVPVSLVWDLTDLDFQQITCCDLQTDLGYPNLSSRTVPMPNGTDVDITECSQLPEVEGNIYLSDGCALKEDCARCRANGSFCDYSWDFNFTCYDDRPANNDYQYPYPYGPNKKLSLVSF